MTFNQLLSEKKENLSIINKDYNLPHKNKILGIINLKDKKVLESLIVGLAGLPINFVIVSDIKPKQIGENIHFINDVSEIEDNKVGFDFFVCDTCDGNMTKNFSKGIVPIVKSDNHLSPVLKEFNAIKNTGNCFLYHESTSWDIFYSIVRYLENSKFSMDKKNLVKNLFEM